MGTASFERAIHVGGGSASLWAPLEAFVMGAEDSRLSAFVAQAKQFYIAAHSVEATTAALPAYYSALNLTKAYLTAATATKIGDTYHHGVSQAFDRGDRYRFTKEWIRFAKAGAVRDLAQSTGVGFCYKQSEKVQVQRLIPYLAEAQQYYPRAWGKNPKLLPIERAQALTDGSESWIRIEISPNTTQQRNTGPRRITTEAALFGAAFELVQDRDTGNYCYQSRQPVKGTPKSAGVRRDLANAFDRALLGESLSTGGQQFIVMSDRKKLLSHEAVQLAVLSHLSAMVRYRPYDVARLQGKKEYWLFATWVKRALDNLLLTITTRMTGERHVVRSG